jgi:hypothetical protein
MYYDMLIHIDGDLPTFNMAIKNVNNYVNALTGEEYSVAIVINGNAIEYLRHTICPQYETIKKLCSGNLRIYACNNAIREHGIEPTELIPEAVVVPAGIVHIVKLQRDGYAYVKP